MPLIVVGANDQTLTARKRSLWVGGPRRVAVGELHPSVETLVTPSLNRGLDLWEWIGRADTDST